ncbi:MAG TPA: carbohydrate ABC transporter permease [Clostridia bacterium]
MIGVKQTNKNRKNILMVFIYIILTLWALMAVVPFVWTLFASFKPRFHIVSRPLELPFNRYFTFENYKKIFSGSLNIFTAYFNSLYISTLVVLFTVTFSLLAAFVLARFDFKLKRAVEIVVIVCMMFPSFALLFPIIRILSFINLFGTKIGVVFPQIALNVGFTTLLLTGFLKSLPKEVEEAAYIDGAKVPTVLVRIIVPMMKSAIVTSMIFVFIWSYNDLFLQMIIITNEKDFPISLLLNKLSTKESGFDHGKMASAVILVSFPIMLVYFMLQRHIIKGLTAGAVKG